MGGTFGKHPDSENSIDDASSKATPRQDESNENRTVSAQHDNQDLLLEKKFSFGNKDLKEQFIREKVMDTSCSITEKSRKTDSKVISNVKRKVGTGSPPTDTDTQNPAQTNITESQTSQKYGSVKSSNPTKGSSIPHKGQCLQTSLVKNKLKKGHYLRPTFKIPKRERTRWVIGAIDLIMKTHEQCETARKDDETSSNNDSNLTVTETDFKKKVVSGSSKVKKEGNIDKEAKKESYNLEEKTKIATTLKAKDSQALHKKTEALNPIYMKQPTTDTPKPKVIEKETPGHCNRMKESKTRETPKAKVIENATLGHCSRLKESKLSQSFNESPSQPEKAEKTVLTEQPGSKLKKCVHPTRVLPKKNDEVCPIATNIVKNCETKKIQPAPAKRGNEIPVRLTLPKEVRPTNDKESQNETHSPKSFQKDGKVTNKQKTHQNTLDANKQMKVEGADLKPLEKAETDLPNAVRANTLGRQVSQTGGKNRDSVDTKSGGKIGDVDDESPANLNVENTASTVLAADEDKKGKKVVAEEIKNQASSSSFQTARNKPRRHVQMVTKTKVSSRKDNVKGRHKKVKLKPPLEFVSSNKQGNIIKKSATSQNSICNGIDSPVDNKPCENEACSFQKINVGDGKGGNTANHDEPMTVNGKEEEQIGKSGTKPEPASKGKTTLKSPAKAHSHRSPAGDSISRITDLNNDRPNVAQKTEPVSDVTQKQKLSKLDEEKGLGPKENPKDVNYLTNDKLDKSYEKNVAEDEEKSSNGSVRKKETKRERRKNREKDKGADNSEIKNVKREKLEYVAKEPVVTQTVCVVQNVLSVERPTTVPSTEAGGPYREKDLTSDIQKSRKKLLVYEKEIKTEENGVNRVIKRKIRKAVRKGPIPKGHPKLMDILFCESCGDTKQPNGQGLFHCPKCKSVFYCTRACQHNDAKRHKKTCAGIKRVFCKHV